MTSDPSQGARPDPAPNVTGHDAEGVERVEESDQEGPVIRDRRRIDPETGELRNPAAAGTADSAGAAAAPASGVSDTGRVNGATAAESADVETLTRQVAERTADLQRLQAEFLNYKRRVDRDRQANRDTAVAGALTELLPVLDDIGRAREHGELEGGFRAVADALEAAVTKLGLERYGEAGEPFDPQIHEALMHSYSDEVTVPTCTAILQPGYRYGERILRATRVAVAEPTGDLPPAAASDESDPPPEG